MHPLTSTILADIQARAAAGNADHPRDLKAAALAYYRYFTGLITGTQPAQESFKKPVDRILDRWERFCEDYDEAHTKDAPTEEMYAACHTGFTELINWMNDAPDTPLRFRKHLAAQELPLESVPASGTDDDALVAKATETETEAPEVVEAPEATDTETIPTAAPSLTSAATPTPVPSAEAPEEEPRAVASAPASPVKKTAKKTPKVKKVTSKTSTAKNEKSKPAAYIRTTPRARVVAVPPPAPVPLRKTNDVYKLRISLEGAEETIWRRVYVPTTMELAELHRLIQLLFDWNGEREHRFKVNYDYFGPANPDGMDQRELYDGVTLESVYAGGTNKLRYTYDFADKWEHLIQIEKILPRDPGVTYPLCTNGAGYAPLDGCGGTTKYLELVEGLSDKQSTRYDLACDILGRDWEPEYFAEGELNKLLRKRFN